jgi:hypothetical protein
LQTHYPRDLSLGWIQKSIFVKYKINTKLKFISRNLAKKYGENSLIDFRRSLYVKNVQHFTHFCRYNCKHLVLFHLILKVTRIQSTNLTFFCSVSLLFSNYYCLSRLILNVIRTGILSTNEILFYFAFPHYLLNFAKFSCEI